MYIDLCSVVVLKSSVCIVLLPLFSVALNLNRAMLLISPLHMHHIGYEEAVKILNHECT